MSTARLPEACAQKDAEIYALRLELAHLRGQRLTGRFGQYVFESPSAAMSAKERRAQQRTLARAEAPMNALWEVSDGPHDSSVGMSHMWAHHINASAPKSGARWVNRWVDSKLVIRLLYPCTPSGARTTTASRSTRMMMTCEPRTSSASVSATGMIKRV